MISAYPDVIPAWTNGTMLPDADRWTKLDYNLRLSRYYPKGKAKKRSKNQISHFLLQRLHEQVHGRSRSSVSFSFGFAESDIERDGPPWNNSIGIGLFLHVRLDSLEQLFDNITSPGKIRNTRTFLPEISKTLLSVRALGWS